MSRADELFWRLADDLMDTPDVEEGTIMNSRCLRIHGDFMAMVSHKSEQLVVKLDKARVAELIENGAGVSFAPAGRAFTEWVQIEGVDPEQWNAFLEEAIGIANEKPDKKGR